MIQMIADNPIPLNKFILSFKHLFSKRLFISFSFYFAGLFLEIKRSNISSITQKSISVSYQNIQYFISDAHWDPESINNHRLSLLLQNPATSPTNHGSIIIDDSACKKWGQHFQSVAPQYYSPEKIITNCNVVVFSAYADSKKSYPINLKPYIPNHDKLISSYEYSFKSKLELAKELVDDIISKEIPFSDILFDNWYFSNDFVSELNSKKLHWISEAEDTRLISYRGKWTRADNLVKVIPCTKFNRKVTLTNAKGKKRSFFVYGFKTKIHGLDGEYLIVIAVGRWDTNDPKNVHIFVTNHLKLDPDTVVIRYALRWKIECIFRDLKDHIAFDHYQVRSIEAITRHWQLCVLAYTFLLWGKTTGCLQHHIKKRIYNIGDALRALRSLNSLTSLEWITNHPHEYREHLGLKPCLTLAA